MQRTAIIGSPNGEVAAPLFNVSHMECFRYSRNRAKGEAPDHL